MKSASNLFSIFALTTLLGLAEELPPSDQGANGVGQHAAYNPREWNGKEQVITRLQKGSDTIVFVRISQEEFEVRKDTPAKEVFFRFSKKEEAMSPGLNAAIMVDFVQAGNTASVLMFGNPGYYYYVQAATTPSKMEPPFYHLLPKALKTERWIPLLFWIPGEPYEAGRSKLIREGVKIARLKSFDEIEFVRDSGKEEADVKDVFLVQNESVKKNGEIMQDLGFECSVHQIGKVDVRDLSKVLIAEVKNEAIVDSLKRFDREELLDLVSKIEDNELRERVSKRIAAAFEKR